MGATRIRPSTVIGIALADHIDTGRAWSVNLHGMDPAERLRLIEHLEALGGTRRDAPDNALQISADFGTAGFFNTWPEGVD